MPSTPIKSSTLGLITGLLSCISPCSYSANPIQVQTVRAPSVAINYAHIPGKKVTIEKTDNAYKLVFNGVEQASLKGIVKINEQHKTKKKPLTIKKLRQDWQHLFGFAPNVSIRYTANGKREGLTLRGVRGTPAWNPKKRQLSLQVVATDLNQKTLSIAPISGNNFSLVVVPTPANLPKSSAQSQAHISSDTTAQTCSALSPAAANSTFCIPYTNQLGSGGESWQNILSGTMQTVQTCENYNVSTQIGGNSTTYGAIDIYETSAEVSQALSVGGSVGYSDGADISLSASYSTSSTQSTSSFYAVAQVNWTGGFVNFGAPSLTTEISNEAAGITSFNSALYFLSTCGDSYPTGYAVGASWASVLQITASSESEAQSISASMSASYFGASAAANFSSSLSSQNSSVSVAETDECWGPSSCFSVTANGVPYQASTSTDMTTAMNIFTSNYQVMLDGLPNACNPGPNYAECIISVSYAPIYTLLPSSFSATSPSALVSNAAYGVFGVQQNLNSWVSGYQSLQTGYPTSNSLATWATDQTNLTDQAQACSIAYLGSNQSCVNAFSNCYNASQEVASYTDSACLPSSFTSNNLYGTPNPWTLQPSN